MGSLFPGWRGPWLDASLVNQNVLQGVIPGLGWNWKWGVLLSNAYTAALVIH